MITDRSIEHLQQNTIKGLGWISIAQIMKQGLQFILAIVLARLLTPYDFGLIGMILVFTGFVALFGELGFSAALIQKDELNEIHFTSIFWLNILSGLILTVTLAFLSPLIAAFYNEPILTTLVQVLSLNFFITSLSLVQKAVLERAMNFRVVALTEIKGVIAGGIVAIILAVLGYGVWSLVWQVLAVSIVTTFLFWYSTSWRPQKKFKLQAVSELLTFSSNLLGFNAFNYWARNADNLLIGKFIGTTDLGIYSRAYTTMLLPISQITNVLSRVMFPAFSRIQHDKTRIKQIYLRSLAMIALITFPMMMGLAVVVEPFVMALYGPKWAMVIPVLRILSLVGMAQSLASTVGWIYQSQGRTDWMFRWGLIAGLSIIISFVVGVSAGTVTAVAFCYAIVTALLLYWNFAIPGKLIGMTFSEVVSSLTGVFGCAAAMATTVWIVGLFLPESWPSWAYLLVQSFLGVISYVLLIHLFKIPAYTDARSLLLEQWQKRRLDVAE